jgi:hypothetical protein
MSKRKRNNRPSAIIHEQRPGTTGAIRQPPPPKLDRVIFCFKYLDVTNKTFAIDQLPKDFGKTLLERFRDYGKMPFAEFAPMQGNRALNSHHAKAERIEAHGGFNVPPDLWQERPWQFKVQNKIRAIGFILGSLFHIVWIDKDHKFDPGKDFI